MKYLFCLLIPLGLFLLVLAIKRLVRSVNSEILYELPCIKKEGVFTLSDEGKYDLWLSGKLFTKSPIGEFGLKLTNKETGEAVPLNASLMRSQVNGLKTGRMKLYSFKAKEGAYVLSMTGEGRLSDKLAVSIMNKIVKQPVDYSLFSVQLRRHTPISSIILCDCGIILGFIAILSGIVLPLVL